MARNLIIKDFFPRNSEKQHVIKEENKYEQQLHEAFEEECPKGKKVELLQYQLKTPNEIDEESKSNLVYQNQNMQN